jgi:hypothetical protein
MSDEDTHEAHPEPEAEDEVEGDGGGEGEDEEVEFQNPFEGQPDPDVFPGGPYDKSALTKYGRHMYIRECCKLFYYAIIFESFHKTSVYGLIMQLYLNGFVFLFIA